MRMLSGRPVTSRSGLSIVASRSGLHWSRSTKRPRGMTGMSIYYVESLASATDCSAEICTNIVDVTASNNRLGWYRISSSRSTM